MAVYIGTSGWSYDHWVDVLYPKSASSLERLDAYVRQFRTVEVNNTFYRWPKDEVFSTWRERSPGGFIFSAKASRGLTQFRKLNDPGPWLERMEAVYRLEIESHRRFRADGVNAAEAAGVHTSYALQNHDGPL